MIIKLQENKSKRVQVAKIGTFDHEVYGKFSITKSDLDQMKLNFESDARRQKMEGHPVLPFDYRHDDHDVAAGWITGLELSADNNGAQALFAEVEWTPAGAQKIKDKEFRFVSPDILRNYQDAETGNKFNVVLKGAALTNIPFLRDMKAVQLLSESKRAAFESLKLSGDNPDAKLNTGTNMELSEKFKAMSPEEKTKFLTECGVELKDVKLSEDFDKSKTDLKSAQDALTLSEKTLTELKTKMAGSTEMEDRLKLAEGESKDLKGKVSSLMKTMALSERKGEFNQMLSEGKVCEAQRKPFMDQDFTAYAKNAQEVKLDESGHGDEGESSVEAAEKKVIKLAEAKMGADKTLDYGDAVSMVLSENKDLRNKTGR